uniref:RRM domain-containing protein n=1 Tax=Araucaria cunninghamii TaxID=56994 RepID=A0A0D6R040_ARACU
MRNTRASEDLQDEHDEEQVDLDGDEEEPEEIMEEEVEDEGDVEEEEKNDGQEGLDLDIAEDDGSGSQDEQEAEHDANASNMEAEKSSEDDGNHDTVEDALQGEENIDKADKDKDESNDEDLLARPPHGTEVFIGNLPRDTTKEELTSLCEECGEVFDISVKREADKAEYAFVTFRTKEIAKQAIEKLNGTEFKDKKLRVSESQPKNRLFLGNIPSNWKEEDLSKLVSEQGPGFQHVELIKDPKDSTRNRGFAFVEYYNKACAEKAMKNMVRSKFKLDDKVITVKWASSQRSSTEEVKSVYVRNLPESVTEEQLKELFGRHGEVTKVVLLEQKPGQAKRDFGFVHFADHATAMKAVEKTEKYELEGRELTVSLARPLSDKKSQSTANSYPFQRSVLPNYPLHGGYGYGANIYGGFGVGFGSAGYGQPVIYGRGPTPAGMQMVPMMLPDGRVGYVLQQPGNGVGASAPYRGQGSNSLRGGGRSNRSGSGGGRQGGGRSSGNGGGSRRYRPY